MPTVKVNDINMYYESHGEGEPLVLLMGLAGGSSLWERQMEFFSSEYQVITFDYRGVGQSDKPDIPYSAAMLVDDVAGLMQSLGIAPAHVYGLSMGGMIAQELALEYPHVVRTLILGATSCGGAHAVWPSEEMMQILFNLPGLPPREAMKAASSLLFTTESLERNPDLLQQLVTRGAQSPPSPQGFKRHSEAISGFDTYDRLQQVEVPTLVIAGTEDRLLPPDNSRLLASRIPGAELVFLEGSGHGYIWEADDADVIVLDFLKRQSGQCN